MSTKRNVRQEEGSGKAATLEASGYPEDAAGFLELSDDDEPCVDQLAGMIAALTEWRAELPALRRAMREARDGYRAAHRALDEARASSPREAVQNVERWSDLGSVAVTHSTAYGTAHRRYVAIAHHVRRIMAAWLAEPRQMSDGGRAELIVDMVRFEAENLRVAIPSEEASTSKSIEWLRESIAKLFPDLQPLVETKECARALADLVEVAGRRGRRPLRSRLPSAEQAEIDLLRALRLGVTPDAIKKARKRRATKN